MMMPGHLNIRAIPQDLLAGVGEDPNNCALAEYIKRHWPQFTHVHVGRGTIRVTNDGVRYEWTTPTTVSKWLDKFDLWKKGLGPEPEGPLNFILLLDDAFTSNAQPKVRTPEARRKARLSQQSIRQKIVEMTPPQRAEREETLRAKRRARRNG